MKDALSRSKTGCSRAIRSLVSLLAVGLLLAACGSEPPTEETNELNVSYVIDGDTIAVERNGFEERVRLLGIDAPEVARDGQTGEPCADEATKLTEQLIAGEPVAVILDKTQDATDRYGRTLAYVEASGRDVSAELLSAGLAEVYYSAPEIERYDDYRALAAQAPRPSCADQ